jgi:GNAT superfamily N-acetyltransferase
MSIELRDFEPRDVEPCGRICYEAFRDIAERHGFPADFPSAEVAAAVLSMLEATPGFYGVVAERKGVVVGSNWLDERNVIAGVGPITIDPNAQDSGVGRRLMEHVLERTDPRGFPGVRLVQVAYHARSLSLYTKLGFASREELAVLAGDARDPALHRYAVRPLRSEDIDSCNRLCAAVHGFNRGAEVQAALGGPYAFVAECDGRIWAYTTGLGYFGHTVGETNDAVGALLASAPRMPSLGVIVPVRNYALFRWSLDHGMHVVLTMTLMSRGIYQQPEGPYLPSILY